jgi:hypothetical protein
MSDRSAVGGWVLTAGQSEAEARVMSLEACPPRHLETWGIPTYCHPADAPRLSQEQATAV